MQAKLVRELNSTSAVEMGGLDYDIIISAYEKINKDFFYTVKEKHALVILSHAVHDMSSEELILRQSAFRLLLSYIEFSAEILEQEMKSDDQSCSESCVHRIINKFFFKHMGDAMNKEASTQKVSILPCSRVLLCLVFFYWFSLSFPFWKLILTFPIWK